MSSWLPSTPSSSIPLDSEGGSHLLSQSLPSPDPFDASSHIHTGPGGADLLLSELSLSDKPYSRDGPRFSLLAQAPASSSFTPDQSAIIEGEEHDEGLRDATVDEHDDANNTMTARVDATKSREEKLQSDLFILKKLNASFAVLNDALLATKGVTQQVAAQLSQTDALLDKYANLLAKSEIVTRLIFDERWEGADADEVVLIREREEALEREREEAARREAEERARREAEEAARREAEERAKQEAAAAALAEKAPAKGRGTGTTSSSGVRGVRGTRATVGAMAARGARGGPKTVSTSTSGIPRSRSASATGSISGSGGGTRPSSSASRGSYLPRPGGAPRRG